MLGRGLHPRPGQLSPQRKSLQPPNVSRYEQISAFHFLNMVPAGGLAGYGYRDSNFVTGGNKMKPSTENEIAG